MISKGILLPDGAALKPVSGGEGKYFLHGDGHILLSLRTGDPNRRSAATTRIGGEWATKFYELRFDKGPKAIELGVESTEVTALEIERLPRTEVVDGMIVVGEEGMHLVVPSWTAGYDSMYIRLSDGDSVPWNGNDVVTVFRRWILRARRGKELIFEIEGGPAEVPVDVKVKVGA